MTAIFTQTSATNTKTHKVLLIGRMYHETGENLLEKHTNIEMLKEPTKNNINDAIQEASAVFLRYPNKLDAESIRLAKKLQVISTSGYGTDAVDIAAATENGIIATALSAANQILQVLQGDQPIHIVNPEVWNRKRVVVGRKINE